MKRVLHAIRDAGVAQAARVTRASASSTGETVLAIQPDHLGDVLLSQPAVQAIRDQYPNRPIVGVVGPWSETVAGRCWNVDDVWTFPFPGFDRSRSQTDPTAPYRALRDAAAMLRPLRPGIAYVLRPDDWWSAWLASAVTAGDVVTAREKRMDAFATLQVDLKGCTHAVERAHHIAIAGDAHETHTTLDRETDRLSYPHNAAAQHAALDVLRNAGINERFMVIHPGAGADVKTWPILRWRAVVERVTACGLPVVITGTASEQCMAEQIVGGIPGATSFAGRTSLDELAETLRLATVVAGPDSGPLHLAVACGTPTIHLFGPSDPDKFGPWGPRSRHLTVSNKWACSRCGDLSPSRPAGCGCMLAIGVDDVVNPVMELLDQHAAV